MRTKSLIPLIAIAALCQLAGPVAAERQPRPAAGAAPALDSFIAQRMEEAGIAGIGAAIIVDRRVVWTKGYGFADRERGLPFTPETVMNIGSISKTFTGVALMRAVQEGKLALDADVNSYLPFKVINPHHPQEKITLRHLATHTSGITDRWAVYKNTYHFSGSTPEPLGDFLKSYFVPGGAQYSPDNFLNARPGTQRDYSNIGAALAGYVVEVVTGEPLNAYTRRHVFGPLKMASTGWSLSEVDPARHSKLYVAQGGLPIPIALYEGTTYPDGGVRTSVADLSRFFVALLDGGAYEGARILEARSVEEMTRFQFTEASKPENVNLQEVNSGLFWATKFDVTRVGHAGSDPGVKTEMLADLSREIGVILFTNTSLSDKELRHHFAIFLELWKHAEALRDEGRAR